MTLPRPPSRRIVVNLVGDPDHGRLAESRFVERPFLPGGEQNLYSLAFAAAYLGHDVELRGWLDKPTFERMKSATGAAPRVGLDARSPAVDDFVVMPEGWREPLDYARLVMSPARLAIYILAAPGLFGWPFIDGPWEPPDPLTVSLADVARPEHFQGMAALGCQLVTHSPGIVEAARTAGVACEFLGTGQSIAAPLVSAEKSVDVLALLENRWAPLAQRVLSKLDGLSIDRVERVSNEEMAARMARARVLVWPSRVEGHASIPWEARRVGCVPVALGSNPFAVGLDEDHGALVVDEVDQIAPATRALLSDPPRWQLMSRRGRETAPAEGDWDAYIGRVERFLAAPPPADPVRAPLAGVGRALEAYVENRAVEAQTRLERTAEELGVASRDLTQATKHQEEMLAEIGHLRAEIERRHAENQALRDEIEAVRTEREHLDRQLRGLLARRSVRAAVRVADTVRRKR